MAPMVFLVSVGAIIPFALRSTRCDAADYGDMARYERCGEQRSSSPLRQAGLIAVSYVLGA
jgi:hypothetical protein